MIGKILYKLIQPIDEWAQTYVNRWVQVYGAPLQIDFPGGHHGKFRVLQDFYYSFKGVIYTVKKGVFSDGSSVPFWARFVCRWFKILISGVAHDDLYKRGRLPDGTKISKLRADWIYCILSQYGADIEERANVFQAAILFFGLALGGWITWFSYRLKDERYI